MKLKALVILVTFVILTSCSTPEKTQYNYCQESSDCEHYWSGYDSGVCPYCDVTDERWICINRFEKTVIINEKLVNHKLPVHCEKCTLYVRGHECKCKKGVCVKT